MSFNLHPSQPAHYTQPALLRFAGETDKPDTAHPVQQKSKPILSSQTILEAVQALNTRDVWVGGGNQVQITVANRPPLSGVTRIHYVRHKRFETVTVETGTQSCITYTRWMGRLLKPLHLFNKKARADLHQAFDRLQYLWQEFTQTAPPLINLKAAEAAQSAQADSKNQETETQTEIPETQAQPETVSNQGNTTETN